MGTAANVLVGAPTTVKIAAYLTAKAVSLTYVDFGFTQEGVSIDPKTELHMVVVDQSLGNVAAVPKARDLEIKVKLAEATMTNIHYALAQASGSISGTSAVFFDDNAAEIYFQLQVIGKGLAASALRTMTAWRAYVKELGSLMFKKDANQSLDLTFGICAETTGSTTGGNFMRFIDT